MRLPSMPPTCCMLAAAVCLPVSMAWAATVAPAGPCPVADDPALIQVVYEDRLPTRDDRRSLEELRGLSGSGARAYHTVLGLTVAEPSVRSEWALQVQPAVGGGVCARPALRVRLGFSVFQIYLARELTDACRRRIVDEHELEHAAAWRSHLRAGARLMEVALRTQLGPPAHFESAAQAEGALRAQSESLVANLLERLRGGIEDTHRAIDSPASYQFTGNRLRACP